MTELVCLDIDGTIAERDSDRLLPEAGHYFKLVGGARNAPRLALVTNQGGPACHEAGWDFSDNFPSLSEVEERLSVICEQITELAGKRPLLLVSLAYQTKSGKHLLPSSLVEKYKSYCIQMGAAEGELHQGLPVPEIAPIEKWDRRLDPQWRKPAPGMILEAMHHYSVPPFRTLMIGDRPEDKGAASAAGCCFQWAQKFFSRGWRDGENYGLL